MRLMDEFDEMMRLRNVRYLLDTMNMICALGDRLMDGLHFGEFRHRLDAALSGDTTPEMREELISELHAVYRREAARLQQRLEVLRYLSSEFGERLERPGLEAIPLAPGELPQPEEQRSLPHPQVEEWWRVADLASQVERRGDNEP